MYFADFNKLKIVTDYNFKHETFTIEIEPETAVKEVMLQVDPMLDRIEPTSLPVLYDFDVAAAWLEDYKIEDLADYLASLANIVVPVVLRKLETGKGYKRERRLDVPDKLKPLHASYGCIKRACNYEIKTPIINIKINFNNVSYLFCMGREIDEIKKEEFVNE